MTKGELEAAGLPSVGIEAPGSDPLSDITGIDEGVELDVIDSRFPSYREHCDDLRRQVENWQREVEAKEEALRTAFGRAAGDGELLRPEEFDETHESFEWEYERRVVPETLEPLPESVAGVDARRAASDAGKQV